MIYERGVRRLIFTQEYLQLQLLSVKISTLTVHNIFCSLHMNLETTGHPRSPPNDVL